MNQKLREAIEALNRAPSGVLLGSPLIVEAIRIVTEEFNRVENIEKQTHYNAHPSGIECRVLVERMSFNLGNALKYIWRAGLKDGDVSKDYGKAKVYLRWEREFVASSRTAYSLFDVITTIGLFRDVVSIVRRAESILVPDRASSSSLYLFLTVLEDRRFIVTPSTINKLLKVIP